ncbi:Pre-mRNA cleavage complex 2 protein Pcf11, partial [Armadillidium vulgare]
EEETLRIGEDEANVQSLPKPVTKTLTKKDIFDQMSDLNNMRQAKTVFEIQKEGPGVEEEKKESSFPLSENDPSPICPMCHEDFKVYFNDDEDCWHLKNAIRKDGILFHPSCYDDHLKILRRQKERDAKHNCARIKEEKI